MLTPTLCPEGHQLGPGRVIVSWSPCMCREAWQAYKGHQTVQCLACSEAGYTTIRYDPPHVRETVGH